MRYRISAVLALAFALPATVWAHGGDTSVIHACVHGVAGNVRFVAPSETCRPPEVAVHLPLQAGTAASGPRGVQLFESDGDFIVPAGVTSVLVELWGGGGGAGLQSAAIGSPEPGAGGGGGGYLRTVLTVSPSQVIPVTVGDGGSAACGMNGGAGGDTMFGTLAIVGGGQGGTSAGIGGAGGFAGGAGISAPGQAGRTFALPSSDGISAQGSFAAPGRRPGQGGFQTGALGTGCNNTTVQFGTGQAGQVIVQW